MSEKVPLREKRMGGEREKEAEKRAFPSRFPRRSKDNRRGTRIGIGRFRHSGVYDRRRCNSRAITSLAGRRIPRRHTQSNVVRREEETGITGLRVARVPLV